MTVHELRQSPEGVVVIHDVRFYGGNALPWHVLWVPPHCRSHWPSQALSQQSVATWSVLTAGTRVTA
ncbi:hypothetical protein [Amycolatopsis thermoflava]|uniref:hypothetical protein n=1 Tax=Amycolatopsis thermoflava TaxID=84480 RepID=UPI0004126BB0|nr:hypothetical protein [Amycolatopsis thermoflava]